MWVLGQPSAAVVDVIDSDCSEMRICSDGSLTRAAASRRSDARSSGY